jgi:hypothetical protein
MIVVCDVSFSLRKPQSQEQTMKTKGRKRFRLAVPEKNARLDVRLAESLRQELETFCHNHSKKLTTAITEALKEYLEKRQREKQ